MEQDNFARLLVELAERMRPSWPDTADEFMRLSERLSVAKDSTERQEVARSVLSYYGGMGSLNDIVIGDRDGIDREATERFYETKTKLYHAADAELGS